MNNKCKYECIITEILRRKIVVEANSQEEACSKIEEAYKNEDIILDSNDFDDWDICVSEKSIED